jgi:2,5-dihydroxypyridine 5,6-dioxygenase
MASSIKFPMDPEMVAELLPTFKQELIECAVKPGESICLVTDARTNPYYPAAFMAAAKELGAMCFQLKVPFTVAATAANPRAYAEGIVPPGGPLEACRAANLVIDLVSVGWLYTHSTNEILDAGCRMLMVKQPEDVLRRLLPHPDVRRRVVNGAAVLEKGRKVRITHPNGTDLTFDIAERKGSFQYGAADIPGRWDHWPSGQCAVAPVEDKTEGVLVVNVGDIILRLDRYAGQPIRITFAGGRITNIEGNHLDAWLLREYLAQWGDPKAYIPAHIGWGCEHRALWMAMALREPHPHGTMDAESFYGDILFGIGANYFRGLGGKNVTSAHIDLCLRGCDFWVDDLKVLDGGTIAPAHLK